jgi:hypothetical protein
MLSTYKDLILKEVERVPQDKMPTLYKIIHLLATELITKTTKTGTRGSLQGIWRGSQVDESLFTEARRSLFPYEYH